MGVGLTEAQVINTLDAYGDNHHVDTGEPPEVNMSHDTQTKSELFELQTESGDTLFRTPWVSSSSSKKNKDPVLGSNYLDHKTSYDWVLANGCGTTLCGAWNTTASIEVQWSFDTQTAAEMYLNSIGKMRLHLSDEARTLPSLTNTPTPPPATVPEPGSLALLGLGIAGLVCSRRKSVKLAKFS